MNARTLHLLLLMSVTLGVALTGFYFVHESLPRALRAPTSLILAPVAVVDGLCHAIGIPGIYGRMVPVFLVNWSFGLVLSCGELGVKRWWRRRKAAALKSIVSEQAEAADR
ncbi:MAG: hypothetical protein FJ253_05505, partial [Phycisphaerae bacterium]|nr:hypothetical protein [Phycisphaerae bacterium]